MQVTVNIPDELAARAQSQGIALETYVEQLVAEQVAHQATDAQGDRIDLDRFFAEISAGSENKPLPAEQAFTRENFYSDHD